MALSPAITLETYSPDIQLRGDCHLWLLDLDQLTEEAMQQQRDILSVGELTRAQPLKRRQLQFIAIRAFVRKCLALYTGIPPQNLTIGTEANGKPCLIDAHLPIQFNLSHCNNMAVVAVGLQDPLGVDVESITRDRGQRKIAASYFHPEELALLATLDDQQHNIDFYKRWTLKEAFFKALGTGISAGLDKAAFYWHGATISVTLADDLHTSPEQWQFYQTFIQREFCLALARRSPTPMQIHCFDGLQLFMP